MFFEEDNSYNEIREKSLEQWLTDMEKHSDIEVRGGIPLVRSYLKTLKDENAKLQEENELKNQYLKNMAKKYK